MGERKLESSEDVATWALFDMMAGMLDKPHTCALDSISAAVEGTPGYWRGRLLSDAELDQVRGLIHRQFLRRIEQLTPQHVALFDAAGLEHYHRYCHLIDHAKAWPRPTRLLPADAIEFFQQSTMLRRLADAFGGAEITNEVEGKAPEIVWRLVRPDAVDDVGPLHADQWFWEIHGWPVPAGHRRIKIWTMVYGEPGRAGLRVAPGSHRGKPWKYEVEHRHGMDKPVFDEKASGVHAEMVDTPDGTSVVFDYGLLHGGSVTYGDICRASFEFTIFAPVR